MSRSSPARKSQQLLSSPDRNLRNSFLFDSRNDEWSHLDALAAAQAEHNRVREAALRVYEMHELKEESDRIQLQQKKEQDRLKAEAEIAARELKLQELRAKSIPRPTPPPEPKPEPVKTTPSLPTQPEQKPVEKPAAQPAQVKQEPAPEPKPQANGFGFGAVKPAEPPVQTSQQPKPAAGSPFQAPSAAAPKAPTAQISQPTPATAQPPKPHQPTERYVQIHQELKKLRTYLQEEAKVPGSPLKGTMGTYRREIRVSIGQLTSGRGANALPVCTPMLFSRPRHLTR